MSVRPTADGVGSLPPYAVYRNLESYPRAFVVPAAAPLPERSQVLEALNRTDFMRTVLLENYSQPAKEPGSQTLPAARISEYLPNRVTVTLDGDGGGYLVLTDVWFPGWTCTVDGEPAPVYRANFLFRAVALPANAHEVIFRFWPVSYQRGKPISSLALMAVVVFSTLALVVSRLRRRAMLSR